MWPLVLTSQAAIAVLHGYAEHSGRYEGLARHFAPLGIAVYACDLRGHGRSPGKRGHIRRFSDYLGDTDAFLTYVERQEAGRRPCLLGPSLGGLIAAPYEEEQP